MPDSRYRAFGRECRLQIDNDTVGGGKQRLYIFKLTAEIVLAVPAVPVCGSYLRQVCHDIAGKEQPCAEYL